MKVFNLRGFDNKANIILNESIALASKYLFEEVNSGHMLYNMLRNRGIADRFEADTFVQAETYCSEFNKILEAKKAAATIESIELGVDEFSAELHNILSNTVHKCTQSNRNVTLLDIYREIMKNEKAEAWNALQLIGVDKARVLRMLDDPLESMPVTAQFAVSYNVLAREGRFDPIEDRDDIIDSIVEVLGRRIKNNPCLVGDAGVGKTAIIEGLAQRLNEGKVPKYLENKHIISVDISGVVAGSKYRGDFEARLNGILNEAAANDKIILFFDEMHMLSEAGAGSQESSMTAANILKPAISRGDVQIIGATTPAEYKRFIEKDKAFERRLQSIAIKEPSVDSAVKMAQAVIHKYNEFHNSSISDDAIREAVILSDRYITDKKLPDKAITVIDETAARLKKNAMNDDKITIRPSDIKYTISKLTGIDVVDLDSEAKNKLKELSGSLAKHVIGQDDAIKNVSRAIKRSRTGVKDPDKPIGTFLFVGPTGVGKTELTKALAIEFGGGIKNLIRFDMSEFMEKHSVSKLIGSPPGYVGYGEGGQLTEAVRKNPYSIILFDEIEKAHPDIFNIMLQILDDGILTDSEGTRVDFKNTVIIMTSNAGYGAGMMKKGAIGFGTPVSTENDADKNEKIAIKALEETFRPEFLNRLDKIVIFNPLTQEDCELIVELMLKQIKKRLKTNSIKFTWDKSLVNHIVEVGFSEKYGARNLKRQIQSDVEDAISDKIIDDEVSSGDSIKISYDSGIITDIMHSLDSISEKKKDVIHTMETISI